VIKDRLEVLGMISGNSSASNSLKSSPDSSIKRKRVHDDVLKSKMNKTELVEKTLEKNLQIKTESRKLLLRATLARLIFTWTTFLCLQIFSSQLMKRK
jgi:hypothetical protein